MKNYKESVVLGLCLVIGCLVGCGKATDKDTKQPESSITQEEVDAEIARTESAAVEDSSETNNDEINVGESWDDYSLVIDGNEIRLPMKFSDFIAMGFYEMDEDSASVRTMPVPAKQDYGKTYNSNAGNLYGLYTNGKTGNIDLCIYNPFDEEKEVQDCYITYIHFEISWRSMDYATVGDVKVVNHTKNAEAVVGESKYDDVEAAFGPHYTYDYSNALTYYPDSNADGVIDMDDLSFYKSLSLTFDEESGVFDIYDLWYYDYGDLVE